MRLPFAAALVALAPLLWVSSAHAEDLGDKLGPPHLWLKADAGLALADLDAFSGRHPNPRGTTAGGFLGADAAVRWERFSLGLRGRFQPLIDYNLIQVAPFVGIHFPQRNFDFSATAHIGYAVASFDNGSSKGLFTGVVVAADYLVKAPLMIGVGIGSDVLLLGGNKRDDVGIGAHATLRLGLLF